MKRSRVVRWCSVAGVVVAVLLGPLATAAVASPLPPCSNYEHREAFGSVLVDTRNPVESRPQLKDDNLHAGLPAVTEQRVNWRRGDTFALRATHLSEGQNAIYVATNDECVIP